jgi:hypothetical protein
MVKYNESTIYKLCCKDVNVTDEYVGSTTNFYRRKNEHKRRCNNENLDGYNCPVYICIRDNGNWTNWDMVEVEKYEATDKQDLHKRERYWIETLKSSLNKQIPTRTNEEYYKDNREVVLKKVKIYQESNKEAIVTRKKKYYESNKETINDKLRVSITCECGTIINKSGLSQHKKSKKHLKLMELIK